MSNPNAEALSVTGLCLSLVACECGLVHMILSLTNSIVPGTSASNGFLAYLLLITVMSVILHKRSGTRFGLRLHLANRWYGAPE